MLWISQKGFFIRKRDIVSHGGGFVISDSAYIVCSPVCQTVDELNMDTGAFIVKTIWIKDSIKQEQLGEFEIYHKPLKGLYSERLVGSVISVNGIQNSLSNFLNVLITHLGGTVK